MKRTTGWVGCVLALIAASIQASCSQKGATQPPSCSDWSDDDVVSCDDLQYAQLQQQLDQGRSEFLDVDAQGLQVAGSAVYWLDFTTTNPTLHRADPSAKTQVDYAFDLGGADAYNFRASSTLVVTAEPFTGVLHAYDAAQTDSEIASATMPAPPADGDASWPYAVDGDTVYLVVEPQSGTDLLYSWQPRQGAQPAQVMTLQAAGVTVTDLVSISVSSGAMQIVDGNGLWTLDLKVGKATQIVGQTAIGSAVDVESDGVAFTFTDADDDDALGFWDPTTATVRDLSQEIAQSSYSIDSTYDDAHEWNNRGFARWGRWVVYGADLGVFGYNLDTRAIEPVLLEPATTDATLIYANPVVLPDGTMLVSGLATTSYVGVQGPVYEVQLSQALQ